MNPIVESDLEHRHANYSGEREISLGPGTILGIFFALALVCACFFGFGYSVGRRSAQLAAPAPVVIASTNAAAGPKPAAGTAGMSAAAEPVSDAADTNTASAATATPAQRVLPSDAIIAGDKPAPQAAGAPAAGSFIVQVAAVSTQQLADIEVGALRKDGYDVVVRHEPQDNLFHVQLGPYSDKKTAEAMRQRILADGFNAIVK